MKPILVWLCLLIATGSGGQSACTQAGQTPETAIRICGTETLSVNNIGLCGITPIPPPCGDGYPYRDQNPIFFRMACYQSGTLGFMITPTTPTADFNWQLFDITSTNPVDIFTNPALFTACNWSAEPGETGASSLGTDVKVCSGAQSPYSKMPDILIGHTYLLMICNSTPVPDGYELSFSGGTAIITEPALPKILLAWPNCSGTEILVRLNKKIKCNTVAADGSDFLLSAGASVIAATPHNCNPLTGADSIFLTLNQPISIGSYILEIKTGSDGNTIADNCGNLIAVGESIPLNITALQAPTVTSISKTGCAPRWIDIQFNRPVACNSIASDGSDFIITGPQTVLYTVSPATYSACTRGLVSTVRLDINSQWITGGVYQVAITNGSDGNSLLDDCGISSITGPAGNFTLNDPISAQFTVNIPPSCNISNASFSHDGNGGASNWQWSFGSLGTSSLQNPVFRFDQPGNYRIQLITGNTSCTDTAWQDILIAASMKAYFTAPAVVCPGDTIRLLNLSTGIVDQWQWDFGNGQTNTLKDPPLISYPPLGREQLYTVKLTNTNLVPGCSDAFQRVIRVLNGCTIAVPSAFTPNDDGINDYLFPLNAIKADQLEFKVYNRNGQLLFLGRDWTHKWDGRSNGVLQDTGVFAWTLSYIHRDSKQRVFLKGTTLLLR